MRIHANATRTVAKRAYPKFGPTLSSVTRNGVPFTVARLSPAAVIIEDLAEIMEPGDVDIVTSYRGEQFRVERTAKAFVTTGRFGFDGIR